MPEVCEVRLTALYLNAKLKGRELTRIKVVDGRYMHKPIPGYDDHMKNNKFRIIKVNSKGKFIWFQLQNLETNERVWLMNGLGLEGRWSFKKIDNKRIKFIIRDTKLNKKYTLWFCDQRNFGNLKFVNDKSEFNKKIKNLSPDLLQESFTGEELYDRIIKFVGKSKSRMDMKIVKVLMNYQERGIGSGIGNYLSAEILYRAKLSPHCSMQSLIDNKKYVFELAKAIKYVIKLCYYTVSSKYTSHFEPWIKKNRGKYDYHNDVDIGNIEFEYVVYRKGKDKLGNIVNGEKILGTRKTYWVPKIQTCV